MITLRLEVPTMYGDHHVIEVRRLLLELAGVEQVYASSAFGVVEVTIDESRLSEGDLRKKLESAGYSGELPVPVETGAAAAEANGKKAFFRHSAAFEQTNNVIGFSQKVPYSGRPLWPCPGMGPIPSLSNTPEES